MAWFFIFYAFWLFGKYPCPDYNNYNFGLLSWSLKWKPHKPIRRDYHTQVNKVDLKTPFICTSKNTLQCMCYSQTRKTVKTLNYSRNVYCGVTHDQSDAKWNRKTNHKKPQDLFISCIWLVAHNKYSKVNGFPGFDC